jgi:type II secretory pathway predicted ATPase ExeA
VITGEIGSGKTTLLRHLLRRLDPKIAVGLISNTPQGQERLLDWVMMSFNQPTEQSYPALFRRFQQFLYNEYIKGRRTILIVDEAQNLGWMRSKSSGCYRTSMLTSIKSYKSS